MDLDQLQQQLMAAARAHPPGTNVPYAFECRIMERIKASTRIDAWSWWSSILWRAATPCLGVMLLVGVWTSWQLYPSNSGDVAVNLNAELETTLYAGLDAADGAW